MTTTWVIGGGGLLGSALSNALRRKGAILFAPAERLQWGDGPTLCQQLIASVQTFAHLASAADQWEIYWAAGLGAMSSTEDTLAPETHTLAYLLQLLGAAPQLMAMPGAIAFASSAGAIYGGSTDAIITEHTAPAPTTAYAREKLKQENLVREFVMEHELTSALVARVSTIYGPGQATGKTQGLLTHIARRMLRNQPIQIYVPFDTIRDYIAADDAAAAMVHAVKVTASKTPQVVLKIIASEHPTTIAEIISIFKRIARRTPKVVTSASKLSVLYSRRVQFHSIVLPECRSCSPISLPVGIAQLMMSERLAYVGSTFHFGN